MIRVLLADDQTLVREAFAMLVESAPDMEVVGQAATGREATELARTSRADLVVMDIRMPDLDGIEATRLIERFLRSPSAPAAGGPECLSEREREVLTLVARGLNNTEIAEALGLSPLTAKTHVSRIMGKLGARDRAQLVVVAYESGMVTPGNL